MRISKTRSAGTELVSKNRVLLNDQEVKPSKELSSGDILKLRKGNAWFCYRVIQLPKSRLGAKLVNDYIHDCTAPEEVEKYRLHELQQNSYRDNGGKPSKGDRSLMRKIIGKG